MTGDMLGDFVADHTWSAIGIVTAMGAAVMAAWAKWAIDSEKE